MPILFIFVLYGGYKTIKNAMKPVAMMSKTALEIGSNRDFSKRIDLPAGKDELHALASVFNQMLDSLEKVYQSEKTAHLRRLARATNATICHHG
ncbi:HAMP domain-containing protein [Campylobacter concisus]|uniref:HAMP domain-containing protein n=1 Tax=Campylobacter concisus TaxID=199 RepID=UPI002156325E|nr:HAMP domain-containing protein [Campylobacter concisus]